MCRILYLKLQVVDNNDVAAAVPDEVWAKYLKRTKDGTFVVLETCYIIEEDSITKRLTPITIKRGQSRIAYICSRIGEYMSIYQLNTRKVLCECSLLETLEASMDLPYV